MMVLLLVFSTNVFATDKVYQEEKPLSIEVITYFNLDEQGEELKPEKNNVRSNNTVVEFKNINLNHNQILCIGDVVNNKKIEFELQGELKKTYNGKKDILIGEVSDLSGNFDVIFFGIDRNPKENVTLNKEILQREDSSEIIKIYLREKDTRNLTIIETGNLFDVEVTEQLFKGIEKLNTIDFEDQNWYIKILKPTDKIHNEIVDVCRANEISSRNGEIISQYDEKFITKYNVGGHDVFEEMKVHFELTGDKYNDGGTTKYKSLMEIIEEKTTSPTTDMFDGNDTNFMICKKGAAYCEFGTDKDVLIKGGDVGYDYYKQGGISVTPYFNLGLGFQKFGVQASINVQLQYEKGGTVTGDNISWSTYDNKEMYGHAMVGFDKGQILKNVKHKFSVDFSITNKNDSVPKGKKNIETAWVFNIYNAYGPEIEHGDADDYDCNYAYTGKKIKLTYIVK